MQNPVLKINTILTIIRLVNSISLFLSIPGLMSAFTRKVNTYLFFKLPAAWWCGIRLTELTDLYAVSTVRHRWFNQNPFKSMFWAVQGMAAELTTGALVSKEIRKSGKGVSMLVLNNKGHFSKKARGRITFRCDEGALLTETLRRVFETGEGHTLWMTSVGRDTTGDVVSEFQFEWTLKARNK